MRKGRSVVHKTIEDNYSAVVGANHEALAQVLEQVRKENPGYTVSNGKQNYSRIPLEMVFQQKKKFANNCDSYLPFLFASPFSYNKLPLYRLHYVHLPMPLIYVLRISQFWRVAKHLWWAKKPSMRQYGQQLL